MKLELKLFVIVFAMGVFEEDSYGDQVPKIELFRATSQQQEFLDELAHRSFLFFWEQGDPQTGLIPDHAKADGSGRGDVASVAASGFALTAYCIGDKHGWITHEEAYERTLRTLKFFVSDAEAVKGFFYHFLSMKSGERVWKCELSSIDTTLMLAGALVARQHFPESEVAELATKIYERVDWPWMQNGEETLCMAWYPESGFGAARWKAYCELMLPYLLGIGSPTNPLDPSSWDAWSRTQVITYGGKSFISCPPLFTHQFSHAWIDFRNQRDDYADYWQNSRLATLSQRQYCVDMASRFPKYHENQWGLTAAVGPQGYKVWGAPPAPAEPPIDGSVVPCAPGGSIPFAPEVCLPTLYNIRETHGEKVWNRYGFVDAYNPHTGWFATDVLAIDVGAILLMIENYQSRFVWDVFHKNQEIDRAMKMVGFRKLPRSERDIDRTISVYSRNPLPKDRRLLKRPMASAKRGTKQEIQASDWIPMVLKNGSEAKFAFVWNERALTFFAEVFNVEPTAHRPLASIHLDNSVELFLDPQNDGLVWGNPRDWQLGFAVHDRCWEWFGEERQIESEVFSSESGSGFHVTCSIPWAKLGVKPRQGLRIGICPAVNQAIGEDSGKTEWHFLPQGERVELGQLVLK